MIQLITISLLLFLGVFNSINCECLAKEHPFDIVKCIDLNPKMIGDLFKSTAREAELSTLCRAINNYLSCMKTYLVGCIGEKLANGGIEEIMDLNKKCCINSDKSLCVLSSKKFKQKNFFYKTECLVLNIKT
jgi:hypothetical protein